jgi:NADH pyrophosphatase NudC (nudix superfamily)
MMKKQKLKIEKPKVRRTWKISPVTRVKPSGKIYKRKGKEKSKLESQIGCEELLGQKNYRYCPRCSAELICKKVDHHTRKVCPVCNFVIYRNPAPASSVIITQDDKILLVKRKYNPFKGDWSLPAGFIEYDESPEQCAIRETKEETNLDVKLNKLFDVYSG